MIIDLGLRIKDLSIAYGISEEECEYLLEVLLLRLFDFGDYFGIDLFEGLGSGLAFVDFVDRVRRDSGGNFMHSYRLRCKKLVSGRGNTEWIRKHSGWLNSGVFAFRSISFGLYEVKF